MAFKGFTWNVDEDGAAILLHLLERIHAGYPVSGTDMIIAGVYARSLRSYMKGAAYGKRPKKPEDRPGPTPPTSLDGYRDR